MNFNINVNCCVVLEHYYNCDMQLLDIEIKFYGRYFGKNTNNTFGLLVVFN